MIRRLLIANRGEISIRIAHTARRMGIETIAVYSEPDKDAPHVRASDRAIALGGITSAESYLRIDKVLDAMRRSNAEAVHPGYGFLSENAEFADAVEAEGFVFVGPRADTIRAMGSKSEAKDQMAAAGVPVTPGYQGSAQDLSTFLTEAEEIGYPVLLKATAGGGGKGMRRVDAKDELEGALAAAKREAMSAFGDDRFLLEKFLPNARHVEVQIFGDGKGNVVHVFERDCSVQRRHQKIIEEAPAPALPTEVRDRLLDAGVAAGKAVNYRGAGTVEFLFDGASNVYFMEMNTRLQVEHPVSEMISGLDFVEWQLRIAAGESLPLEQNQIETTGHAVEARLYAEDPNNDFAPSTGTLTTLKFPTDVRVDSGVVKGQEVSPYYDPMIAKIIAHAASRGEAIAQLRDAVSRTRITGIDTNSPYLSAILNHPTFCDAVHSTGFVEQFSGELTSHSRDDRHSLAALIVSQWLPSGEDLLSSTALTGFRINANPVARYWFEVDGVPALVTVTAHKFDRNTHAIDGTISITLNDTARDRRNGDGATQSDSFAFSGQRLDEVTVSVTVDDVSETHRVLPHRQGYRVFAHGTYTDISNCEPGNYDESSSNDASSLRAILPGVVTIVHVTPGEQVTAGANLITLEAMKMEHTVRAPYAAEVKKTPYEQGDTVQEGDLLIELVASSEPPAE